MALLAALAFGLVSWHQANRLDEGQRYRKLSLDSLAAKNVPAALTAARRAAELMPDDADAVGLYGLMENQATHPAAALAALRRANALRPDDRDYLIPLVQLEMESEDIADSERDLAPWLQAHPQDAWACRLMAVIYEREPRTADTLRTALAYEARARAGMPDDLRIYLTLGQLFLEADRPAYALRAYQNGPQLEPRSEPMLQGLLTCYTRLGETQKAAAVAAKLQAMTALMQRIDHLQDTLRLEPSNTDAGLELARLEEEDGNLNVALSFNINALRRAPHDPRARAALVAFYRRHNRPVLAKEAANPAFVP